MNAQLHTRLQAQIAKLDSISAAPAILQPLLDILRLPSDQVRLEKVVELVSYDGAIAAQCLRLANSPLFGMRYIETVRTAVMALGIERVRSLLFGLCINRVIPQNKWVIAPDAFWRHSLGCALVTQRMARKIEYPEPEKAYLAGLLHDLGFLANSVLYTEDFRECLRRAAEQHVPLHVIEEKVLGFTHCDAGQMLCEHWGLSTELVDTARCHHDVSLLPDRWPAWFTSAIYYAGRATWVTVMTRSLGLILAVTRRGQLWWPAFRLWRIWTSSASHLTLMEPWARLRPRWTRFLDSKERVLLPPKKVLFVR